MGLALVVIGLTALCWGVSASLGLVDEHGSAPVAAHATEAGTAPGAGSTSLQVDAAALGHDLPLDVALPANVPLLGSQGLDTGALPVHVGLKVREATPGSAPATTTQTASTQSVSQRAVALAPQAVALSAAAFTAAGLVAYFWGAIKAWGARALIAPAIGMYAKITRAEVFDNDVRERIFAAIRAQPGISASDLAKLASVSWGTTIYHLEVLEQNRMVTSLRKGRHRRYFENGAELTASKDVVALLQNPVTASIARTIRDAPGATQKDLAHATGMSPQALHWHLARLCQAGVVRKERAGRFVKHFASA